jgi:[ribosomal protein S18]-alanine N-acetyltransferase
MTVKIRHATAEDIPAIMDLERACATAAHWSEAQYRQSFEASGPERIVFVAVREVPPAHAQAEAPTETGLAGFLVARQIAPDWELENIVVAQDMRRKGLGKRILDALLVYARETNIESVFLEVRESNSAARALYEKAGFRQVGSRKSYYVNPLEAAILYRRDLGAKPFSE